MEAAFGVAFLAAPHLTMDVLGVRPSPEAAALFRLYGILLVARALLHHATFGVPEPRVVRCSVAADLAFAVPSAVVLTLAIRDGLAGAATWVVVALFAAEGVMAVTALAGLRSVTREDLAGALAAAKGRIRAPPRSSEP